MMKKKKIKEIVKDQIKNLQNKFNKIVPNFDPEDIHKFRLEYKKMRAFFRMIQQNKNKVLKSNFPESLKNIYKITGKIRDLQLIELNINRLIKSESKVLVGYFTLLKKKIQNLKLNYLKPI